MTKSVYHIPVWNLAGLDVKLTKLNRRAVKNGIAPIVWTDHGHFDKKVFDYNRVDDAGRPTSRMVTYAHVTVDNRIVKVSGWTFMGTVAHNDVGNVLRMVPGSGDAPLFYRDAAPVCDHCGTKRRRKDTYLLADADGVWKMVGSNCLADFLGTDPTHAAAMAEFILTTKSAMDEESGWGGGGGGEFGYDPVVFLGLVARTIRSNGWVSKGAAMNTGTPATATLAERAYTDWHDKKTDRWGKRYTDDPTEAEIAEATEALNWARGLDGHLSDYLHNVKVTATVSPVTWKGLGILASVIPAWRKATEAEIARVEAKKAAATSKHLGKVGDRLTFTGKVMMVKEFGNDYGATFLTKFVTNEGDTVVWWASRELTRGETYTVTATVKDHKTFANAAETVITRGRVK